MSNAVPLITGSAELADFCRRARGAAIVALDTEFLCDETYYAELCLIQLAYDGGAALVDPLAAGLDLAPLEALLYDSSILKIAHASYQDVKIFYQRTGRVIAPLFDTQIAAQVCNFPANAPYALLAERLAGTEIDKALQRSNWRKRPLSKQQQSYALRDVVPLLAIYQSLQKRLKQTERGGWIAELMTALADPALYDNHPKTAWQRVRTRIRGQNEWLALAALACWREAEAQRCNRPRPWIMPDKDMHILAKERPKTLDEMKSIRLTVKHRPRQERARGIIAALGEREQFLPQWETMQQTTYPPLPSDEPRLQMLKALLKTRCAETGVAASLIAANSDLDAFIRDAETQLAQKPEWQKEIFWNDALAVLRGEKALRLEEKSVLMVSLRD